MREIVTSIRIEAPANRVYETLIDFESYGKWNPFLPQAQGRAELGEKVRVVIRAPGAKDQTYTVRITGIVPNKELRWLGHMGLPGLLDGDHIFQIVPEGPNQTMLIHREHFSGLLVPLVWNLFLNTKLRAGFIELNLSLKKRVEEMFHSNKSNLPS